MQEPLAPIISQNQTTILSSNVRDRLARVRAAVTDQRQTTSRLVSHFADKIREPRPSFADQKRP